MISNRFKNDDIDSFYDSKMFFIDNNNHNKLIII